MDGNYRRDTSAGYLTNWAARLLTRSLERRLRGGSAGTMPVFFALIDGGAQTQAELARWAAVEQPTMANTLARMERDGMIVREPSPDDRRTAQVRLTPSGLERAKVALNAAIETNDMALGAFKPAERTQFLELLKKLIAHLEQDRG